MDVRRAPGPLWSRLSVIWIVPLLAIAISVGVAVRTYSDRGTLIEVTFAETAGILAGETVLKYREVQVGRVERIGFTGDLSRVLVTIRVDKDVAPFIDADSKFWLVRPQLTTSGISRLDTVLTGTFIEGLWDSEITAPATRFAALAEAPLARTPGSGTWITLFDEDGGALAEGAPVIYRGIKVGQLRNVRLDDGTSGVRVDAFINAPFDQRLTTSSVFWDTSGFSVSLGATGLKLNVRSLASLIQGGVEFTTLVAGGTAIVAGHSFRIFADEATARDSVFSTAEETRVKLSILLDGSIRSLTAGAAVQYRGLTVGEVTNLSVRSDPAPNDALIFRQQVDLSLGVARMGLPPDTTEADALQFIKTQVDGGLRARVVSAGLLGGALVIELAEIRDAIPETLALDALPFPIMPTAPALITDFSSAAGEVLSRVQSLPIEELMQSAIDTLDTMRAFVAKDDTQNTPKVVVGLVEDLRTFVASEDLQAAPGALRDTLDEAQALLAELQAGDAPARILTAIDEVTEAATAVTDAATGLPALVASLDELTNTANDLPLKDLVASATKTVDEIGVLIGSDDTKALPKALSQALDQITASLQELRDGGAVTNLNEALAAARTAADSVSEASESLPDLVERLDRVIANIDGVVEGYGQSSPFGKDTLDTLRELRRAATSVGSLARTIERNPQAFLLGR